MSYVEEKDEPGLPAFHILVATRAANEGIPIAAIARVLNQPFSLMEEVLRSARRLGHITQMPKGDWPPGVNWAGRLPTTPRAANAEDIEFACRKTYRLTPLEAALMLVLLRCEFATKDKLHNVVETQRQHRQQRPDNPEETDPKIVDVVVCKLRKKLRDIDKRVAITTSWGKGYYMEPKVKELVYAAIGGTPDEKEAVAAGSPAASVEGSGPAA